MNLVENAWESMESKAGTVRTVTGKIMCRRSYLEQAAWVENCVPGEYVFIEVADDGCGMDAETINRAFDPFFTNKESGTGIGLAMVKQQMNAMNGQVLLESKPGRGTTFLLELPTDSEASL